MAIPSVLVLTGYGINCDEETAYAFELAGAHSRIIHINDLIERKTLLADFHVLVFPGGFSFGDDTGSGYALAGKIRNHLWQELQQFLAADRLALGICNGFQVMVNLGLLPALDDRYGEIQAALQHNVSARYECRWVDLAVKESACVFTRGLETLHLPVAHGEGNFYAENRVLAQLAKNNRIVLTYVTSKGKPAQGRFPYNPNGAAMDIAGVCDPSGRILGLMPHPERFVNFTQRENWTLLKEHYRRKGIKIPEEGDGMAIFKNAAEYFK